MKPLIAFTFVIFIAGSWGSDWKSGGGCSSWGDWSDCKDDCKQCKWCHDSTFKGPDSGTYSVKVGKDAWNRRGNFPTSNTFNDYMDGPENGQHKPTYMHAELHLPGKPVNDICPGEVPTDICPEVLPTEVFPTEEDGNQKQWEKRDMGCVKHALEGIAPVEALSGDIDNC